MGKRTKEEIRHEIARHEKNMETLMRYAMPNGNLMTNGEDADKLSEKVKRMKLELEHELQTYDALSDEEIIEIANIDKFGTTKNPKSVEEAEFENYICELARM